MDSGSRDSGDLDFTLDVSDSLDFIYVTDTGFDYAGRYYRTCSALANQNQSNRQVENFFISLKLYDISGLAYLEDNGDLYLYCGASLSTTLPGFALGNPTCLQWTSLTAAIYTEICFSYTRVFLKRYYDNVDLTCEVYVYG